MNKKIMLGVIAVMGISCIVLGQANASYDKSNLTNRTNMEKMNKGLHMGSGDHRGSGLHLGSGYHTGLKLGSGNRPEFMSGYKGHMGSGNKMHFGSGDNLGTGMDKKVEKLGSVFKKMTDEKLTLLLTQINTLTTNITDLTLLSIINSIKTMIQHNIGN